MKKIFCTLTHKCNNRCLNCFIPEDAKDKNMELSLEELKLLLSKAAIEKNDTIQITGGEPTLHKDLLPILSHIKETYSTKVILITNAQRCSDKVFASEISGFIDTAVITIYSVNASTHDYITRTKGSYVKKIEGSKNLNRCGIKTEFKIIPMLPNYKELPDFVDFCAGNFQTTRLIIKTMDIVGCAKENRDLLVIRYSNVVPYLEKALKKSHEHGVSLSVFMPPCLVQPSSWDHFPTEGDVIFGSHLLISHNRGIRKSQPTGFPKTEKCGRCLLKRRCSWFWKEYMNIFGDGEFRPVEK